MSSHALQNLCGSETSAAVTAAIATVAERSFFAFVDRCDQPLLAAAATSSAAWLTATIRFDDGPITGSMACTVPEDLARSLFDAFSGRDPSEPLPSWNQLVDLVGEFSNIVCGTWLTRCAGDRAFRLSPPLVVRITQPAADAGGRIWLAVNNRPLAVDLHLAPVPGAGLGLGTP
jgi:hypothetical protein